MDERVNQLVTVSNKNSAILEQLEKKITQNDSLQEQLIKKQSYIEHLEASNDSLRRELKRLSH
jgi:cell division protein FtsB